MTQPLEHLRMDLLLGRLPRHNFDLDLETLPVDGLALEAARKRVRLASRSAERIADELEQRHHELGCIEDGGFAGALRHLMAMGLLTTEIRRHVHQHGETGSAGFIIAIHWAVEERWIGGTYDLSTCHGALDQASASKTEEHQALGTWILMNLTARDESHYFRWVISTRRFQTVIGAEVARWPVGLEGREPPEETEISSEAAKRIALNHLSQNPGEVVFSEIDRVVLWKNITWRRPVVYGKNEAFWERQWILYLRQPSAMTRSSFIVVVDRKTGEVGFVGSANDEG